MSLKLFWWKSQPNFGDRISKDIVAYVSGQTVEWAGPEEAEMIGVGSIMYAARQSFKRGNKVSPWLWGTGAMKPLPTDFIDHIQIAALRGPITREILGVKTEVFGDPGLLMPLVLGETVEKTGKIGVIPHISQADETAAALAGLGDKLEIIDPRGENHLDVVRQIAGCDVVFSSSLHGLIIADAFGVPNVWLDPDGNHPFARLKFYDYAAGIGRVMPLPISVRQIEATLDAGIAQVDYGENVRQAQKRLMEAFPAAFKAKTAPKAEVAA